MDKDRFLIGEALGWGWESFKANAGFLILYVLILMLVGSIPNLIQGLTRHTATYIIFGLIEFVLGVFINMAYVKVGLSFCDQKPPDFSDLYSSYERFLDFLIGSVLYGLIVLGGLILLIVPGIIFAIKFGFFAYLVIDREMDPIEALKSSWRMTNKETGHLFVFGLAAMGLILLGLICCFVGVFVTAPVVLLGLAYIYRSLLASWPELQVTQEPSAETVVSPAGGPAEPTAGEPTGPSAPGDDRPPAGP
jgi:hypothetical protein